MRINLFMAVAFVIIFVYLSEVTKTKILPKNNKRLLAFENEKSFLIASIQPSNFDKQWPQLEMDFYFQTY